MLVPTCADDALSQMPVLGHRVEVKDMSGGWAGVWVGAGVGAGCGKVRLKPFHFWHCGPSA